MAFGKKNVVKIDPLSYNMGLIGDGGCGKTTIVYEMCEKLTNGTDGGYLFAECGKEEGADAISGINYINCPDWGSDYDELNNSVGFNILVDDIIENKSTEYPNLRVLIVDTYDQLRAIAEPEIIRQHNKTYPEKKVNSIKAAFGGYMAGEDMCDDMILDKLWELKKVGVQFFIIGHVKQREITDSVTGDTYTQLTTDMSMRSFNKIKTKLHFLGVASVDREIVKEKRNKKDINSIKAESRKITFRDNNYSLDSKSRFADIVDEIPMDSDALIKALTDAIESEAKKGDVSIEKLKDEQNNRNKAIEEKAKNYSKSKKENKIDVDKNEKLLEEIKSKFTSAEKEIKDKVKEIMVLNNVSKMGDTSDTPTKVYEDILAVLG